MLEIYNESAVWISQGFLVIIMGLFMKYNFQYWLWFGLLGTSIIELIKYPT